MILGTRPWNEMRSAADDNFGNDMITFVFLGSELCTATI